VLEHDRRRATEALIPYNPEIIVYLLHCEMPDGGAEHYIGSCRIDQYKRRMRMHAQGNGAEFTKKMYAFGARFYVALTWDKFCREFERQLLGIPNIGQVCPICSPSLRGPRPVCLNPAYAPVTRWNGSQLLDFPKGR
jgi:predicted GIY-YIG superfamily endonuclease